MKLPPVDQYRQPFVEPIGHLVMQSAYVDDELITLCAVVPFSGSPDQCTREAAAHRLRNWTSTGKSFASQRIALIQDRVLRTEATLALNRFDQLRELRHRVIHDAIGIGVLLARSDPQVAAVRVEYKREGNGTASKLYPIAPEAIADIACELYEIQKTFARAVHVLHQAR